LELEAGLTLDPETRSSSNPAQFAQGKYPDGVSGLVTLDRQSDPQTSHRSTTQLWAHRLMVLVFVFFCATLGVILVVYPWSDDWVNNRLLFGHSDLQQFLALGFVRGLCSGLGLLDIWIGFWEAVHYHE
jgi:hypothetical protein